MNPPLAFNPLIAHIPHAVPVVIVWGIMLRFYFAQRKSTAERHVASSTADDSAIDRPAKRRVWAADDIPPTGLSTRPQQAPVDGRTPAGRH
jgi:hypothetical protein